MSAPDAEMPTAHRIGLPGRAAVLGPAAAHTAFVLELTLVPLLLPSIRAQFDFTLVELAWVFNAYSVAVAVGVFSGGFLGDRLGNTRVFCYGVGCFLVGSVLLGIAAHTETLILGRMLQGLGAGVFSPLVPLLLTRAVPDRPGRTLILWGSLAGYIAAFGPLTYGRVLDGENWNFAFLFIAAFALFALMAVRRGDTPEGASENAQPQANYLAVFHAGKLWLTLGYVFMTYGAITYFLFRLPLWLTELGYTGAQIGLVLSLLWLSFSGASTVLRNKVDQHHLRAIVVSAPIFIAAGTMLSYGDGPFLLALAAVLVGCGLACSNAPSTQLILRHAPEGLSALSTSLDIAVARLGGIVLVAAITEFGSLGADLLLGALSIAAVICAFVISQRPADGAAVSSH